ncbi:polysaccharide deacetylase family protein [Sphingomonas sp. MAH-20]|uniref:Chitooligosaccharide deacetylase n=1 Tax=Sphingomonas horti TaxID=2682842 RepID=A0A6I4J4P0_9SPHN|nr:polysaccharide deacetylase family protein [Sphingomonas sp. CGMCC 1.13658]MBA2919035.1 polysaccharide deacetylase family protein [Sphingomonas sp. CGMCC 1.13658]MVO79068.1 polysaccharide deacetylase family protein [Sphingomonas horti]
MRQLNITFHGLGAMPATVDAGEARVWCADAALYADLVDEAQATAAAHGIPLTITFDDGNLSDATIGAPVLARRGLTGIFFPCAGRIGTPGYLDAAALRDLHAGGMGIGSHGWAHTDWRRADDAAMAREIGEAKDRIEQAIGAPVTSAAIPFGSYDRRVLRHAAPFATVYTSDGGLARQGARVQSRTSYTTDWRRGSVARLAETESRAPRRLRGGLKMLYKSMR